MKTAFSKIIAVLAFAGVAFSGYLSGTKFFSGSCALNETCPYFFGYPACYFGFALFLLLAVASVMVLRGRKSWVMTLIIVSGLGILFAGYYTIGELPLLFSKGLGAYVLGLPTCALGLIFFVLVFVLSLVVRKKAVHTLQQG